MPTLGREGRPCLQMTEIEIEGHLLMLLLLHGRETGMKEEDRIGRLDCIAWLCNAC
jgi:hypothetical protein